MSTRKKNNVRLAVETLENRLVMSAGYGTALLAPVKAPVVIGVADHGTGPMAVIHDIAPAVATPTKAAVDFAKGVIGYEREAEVIPVNVARYAGRPPVFYVNGILNDRAAAVHTGELLSAQLGRPVYVIHNQTQGAVVDLIESGVDEVAPFVPAAGQALERIDPTTRKVLQLLRTASQENVPVAIVSHSEGNLQVRDALDLLARDPVANKWVQEKLAWVALAPPFNVQQALLTRPNTFTAIYNKNDGVTRILGGNGLSLENLVQVGQTGTDHAVTEYLKLISPNMLAPVPGHSPSTKVVDIAPPPAGVVSWFNKVRDAVLADIFGAVRL